MNITRDQLQALGRVGMQFAEAGWNVEEFVLGALPGGAVNVYIPGWDRPTHYQVRPNGEIRTPSGLVPDWDKTPVAAG